MSSVRARLDREREKEDKVVPTENRRVALTGGPTLSTRQQADFATSQNEVTVRPTERTTAASVDYGNGDLFSRTSDRRRIAAEVAEVAKPTPKTASQLAGEAGLAEHKERQAREAAAEAQKYATGRKVNVMDRQIAEAKAKVAAEVARQKKAQHDFLEAAVMREAEDLTDEEKTIFWTKLVAIDACLDAGKAAIVAEAIRLERK